MSKVDSAELAEFYAAKEAIIFAVDAGFRELVVEGDCRAVIYAICAWEEGVSSGGVFVADIARLGRLCHSLDISFVRRKGNSIAHAFAKFAIIFLCFCFKKNKSSSTNYSYKVEYKRL